MGSKQVQVSFKIPGELVHLLAEFAHGKSNDDNVRISLAVGLFLAKTVSLGKASEIAGLPLNDFIFLLKTNNIPWKDYCTEDLFMDEQIINEAGKGYKEKP